MNARLAIVSAAALALAGGCKASDRTKTDVEDSMRRTILSSLAPREVECELKHSAESHDKLLVLCRAPAMSHTALADGVKAVLAGNCELLKRADFSKVEISVPRHGGGEFSVLGTVGEECNEWVSLAGLF